MKLALSFLAILAIPTGVFAIGSVTGDHSIQYTHEGTWLCHIPHSDRSTQTCTLLAPVVPASYMQGEGNRRGYINCIDGKVSIGNIDIRGNFVSPIITMRGDECAVRTLD